MCPRTRQRGDPLTTWVETFQVSEIWKVWDVVHLLRPYQFPGYGWRIKFLSRVAGRYCRPLPGKARFFLIEHAPDVLGSAGFVEPTKKPTKLVEGINFWIKAHRNIFVMMEC